MTLYNHYIKSNMKNDIFDLSVLLPSLYFSKLLLDLLSHMNPTHKLYVFNKNFEK
jgi:hypothetical protein